MDTLSQEKLSSGFPTRPATTGFNLKQSACLTGVQFEGDLGKTVGLGAEISPIGLREKWESP